MPIGDKKGGFIRPGYDPLEVPNEPTSVSVTAGDTELEVSFTALQIQAAELLRRINRPPLRGHPLRALLPP